MIYNVVFSCHIIIIFNIKMECRDIPIVNDEVVEPQKDLILTLELYYHNPGVTVGDGKAVVMIEEDGM